MALPVSTFLLALDAYWSKKCCNTLRMDSLGDFLPVRAQRLSGRLITNVDTSIKPGWHHESVRARR